MTLRLLQDSLLYFCSRRWIIALGDQGKIGGPGGCCDLRTGVGNVGAAASSGVGNVDASATSLPVNYSEFGPRQRRCVGNVGA